MKTLFAFLAAALLSGCAAMDVKLPAITARHLTYDRAGRFTATKIEATNIVDRGDRVTADLVDIKHDNPYFNARIRVEGYERMKAPAEAGK